MEQLPNKPSEEEEQLQKYEKPISEHFIEMRRRMLTYFAALLIVFFALSSLYGEELMQIVIAPVKARGIEFIYVGLAEALIAELKVCFIASVIITFPVFLWQVWSFIKPALYENEQKGVIIFTTVSLLLFLIGVVFGYGVVFISAITFFVYVGQSFATPMLSISDYVGFLLGFVIPFGLVFEMPIIAYILGRMGIVTTETLTSLRKYIILVIFIVAAFLTPPDVLSQVLMALPMLVLYEVGVIVVRLTGKKQ